MTMTSLAQIRPENRPIAIAAGFILVILALGTAYTLSAQGTAPLLSPNYLLQQLQIGSFLGIVAAGMMMVILLGHIDLSVPWTLTAAAMMATTVGGPWAIPAGLAVGVLVGLFNGFGVAWLRIPSMIFTLGVDSVMRGLMVAHTGGFAPQTDATPLMRTPRLRPHPRHPQRHLRLGRRLARRRDDPLAHRLRPRHLRHRHPRGRRLPLRHPHPPRHRRRLRRLRHLRRHGRRAPRRLLDPRLPGHGQRLPAPGDRRRRPRRHPHPRRQRPLRRHRRRRHPDRAPELGALDHADARGRPADHLRRGDRRPCCWSMVATRRSRPERKALAMPADFHEIRDDRFARMLHGTAGLDLHLDRRPLVRGPRLLPGRPLPRLVRHPERPADALGRVLGRRLDLRAALPQPERPHRRPRGPARRLRAPRPLRQPHRARRHAHRARRPLRGHAPQLPERRRREVRRLDLVHRPELRHRQRVRGRRRRVRDRRLQRLPHRPRRRRRHPRHRRPRPAERHRLLARRVAALRQPTPAAATAPTTSPRSAPTRSRSTARPSTTATTSRSARRALFDGFRVDTRGHVWSSAGDGVHCFAPDGTLLGKILVPEICANVCFGGRKRNRLFICATTSVFAHYVNARGCGF